MFFLRPTSRQQTQAGDLGGEEGVQDEDDGLRTGVQVQLLEERRREGKKTQEKERDALSSCIK